MGYGYQSNYRFGLQSGYLQGSGYVAADADAQAFITAAAIIDNAQKAALDSLVIGLKADSLWAAKVPALYPIIGGTAESIKWNLRDPRDLDAAYRLTFAGGWTHSATGMLPNGSTGFADTHFAGTAHADNNHSFSFYSGTDTLTGALIDMGVQTGGVGPQMSVRSNALGGEQAFADNPSFRTNAAVTDAFGMVSSIRTTNTLHVLYKNGAAINTNVGADPQVITSVTHTYYIGARNNGGVADAFCNRECRFAILGPGRDATEELNLYNRVQTFMTALSRNV